MVHFKKVKFSSMKEEVFLAYFNHLSKRSSTLWSKYSIIKLVLKVKHNIDISKFYKLTAFFKKDEFRPKK